ncbi:hypothetical protein EYF80_018511 [Liparis tanakae]|uniref:Uncharacterized protein n=1 Tax=Liparis tanakae TaxID=230148 RepID=A0A4Z2HZN2_9TELE|nr:hypothetical protein EYF80_018511 [Liparis tanakae]
MIQTSTIHQADGGREEEWAESQRWAESQQGHGIPCPSTNRCPPCCLRVSEAAVPAMLSPAVLPRYSHLVITANTLPLIELFQHQLGAVVKGLECRNNLPIHRYKYFKGRRAE